MKIPEGLNPNVAPRTLSVYTRHAADCKKHGSTKAERAAAKHEKRCNCPKWIYLFHDGKNYRFTAATRSWEKAEQKKQELERQLDPEKAELRRLKEDKEAKRMPISAAIDVFLSDAKKRNLAPETHAKLRTIFEKQFLPWTQQNSLGCIDDLTTAQLTKWRSTWSHAPSTSRNRQEILRGFCRFCIEQGWLTKNPAAGLSRIKVRLRPTDYFPPEEFDALVRASYSYGKGSRNPNAENCAIRIRTLLLLMRCSGLRIGDAVSLERSRLVGDNILLYQAKTGEPVFVPLPPQFATELRQIPPGVKPSPTYFFWGGNCTLKSAVKIWEQAFRRLFKIADIRKPDGTSKRCQPRMLRDTFAVEMLLAGVALEKVSVLLGHASVKTTEKHYAPWVRARQQDLEATVSKAWLRQRINGITTPLLGNSMRQEKQNVLGGEQRSVRSFGKASGSSFSVDPGDRPRAAGDTVSFPVLAVTANKNRGIHAGASKKIDRKLYRRFPYTTVAKLWAEGKTIKEIAIAIERLDVGIDPSHTVRTFLTRMHKIGYKDEYGQRVRLPYRRPATQ
jgi:integrase/recombinase XerD